MGIFSINHTFWGSPIGICVLDWFLIYVGHVSWPGIPHGFPGGNHEVVRMVRSLGQKLEDRQLVLFSRRGTGSYAKKICIYIYNIHIYIYTYYIYIYMLYVYIYIWLLYYMYTWFKLNISWFIVHCIHVQSCIYKMPRHRSISSSSVPLLKRPWSMIQSHVLVDKSMVSIIRDHIDIIKS